MRVLLRTVTATLILALVLLCQTAEAGRSVFQYSTIDALLAGLYDGKMSMKNLKYQGDFGLGTLNGLDGELVVLEGQAYHIKAGGKARIPEDSEGTPFATVSFFEPDTTLTLGKLDSLKALNEAVLKAMPTENIFCAIRIDAKFSQVKTRAIPKQTPPYEPLAKVVKKQVVVNFSGPGTLVGYYSPSFVKGVNVPGFHWHFLTQDRTGGGHVLDCVMQPTTAKIDFIRGFTMHLPASKEYDNLDLTPDRSKELHSVEKDPIKK